MIKASCCVGWALRFRATFQDLPPCPQPIPFIFSAFSDPRYCDSDEHSIKANSLAVLSWTRHSMPDGSANALFLGDWQSITVQSLKLPSMESEYMSMPVNCPQILGTSCGRGQIVACHGLLRSVGLRRTFLQPVRMGESGRFEQGSRRNVRYVGSTLLDHDCRMKQMLDHALQWMDLNHEQH